LLPWSVHSAQFSDPKYQDRTRDCKSESDRSSARRHYARLYARLAAFAQDAADKQNIRSQRQTQDAGPSELTDIMRSVATDLTSGVNRKSLIWLGIARCADFILPRPHGRFAEIHD